MAVSLLIPFLELLFRTLFPDNDSTPNSSCNPARDSGLISGPLSKLRVATTLASIFSIRTLNAGIVGLNSYAFRE